MREYHFFLGDEQGVFGFGRRVWMANDYAALDVGYRLLDRVAAIDIWGKGHRVAILNRAAIDVQPHQERV